MEAGEQPAEVWAIDPAGLRDGVERRDLDKIPFDELLGPRERAEGVLQADSTVRLRW